MKHQRKSKAKASSHESPAAAKSIPQPAPFTPGVTRLMVREHARRLYRDKLEHAGKLTLADWVLAEKDLVQTMQTQEVPVV